jgi:hypothetical protein
MEPKKSLPLTPFESFLYHDDVPAYPCWQVLRLTWRGRIQREALERAWADSTARHPLLSAVVRRGPLGGLRWELRSGITPPVHWSRREPGREWPEWQPIDLSHGPGVRLYMVEDDGRTDSVLCTHHAVCDGLSLLDILTDVFSRYAAGLGDAAEPKPDATFESLRDRGRFGRTLWDRCWLPVLQTAGIIAESGLLRRTVAPLVPHSPAAPDGPRPDGWPTMACRTWTAQETAAIRDAAKKGKVSVAELCMRDLQAAIGTWRLAQGIDAPDDWIRLGTAVSLRQRTRGSWPAANLFGISIIDRQARSLANRERLLRRAHEDMALVEDWRFGYAFWMLLRLRRWWPGGIRAYSRRPVVRMTCIMSFMGKVLSRMPLRHEAGMPAVPGAVLEDLRGVAPTRPGTCACMDAAIFFGNLVAHLHYDPRVLKREHATALVDEFARQLARSAAGS